MKADRSTKLRLVNKHFRTIHGKEYLQKKIVEDKARAQVFMKKKYLGRF